MQFFTIFWKIMKGIFFWGMRLWNEFWTWISDNLVQNFNFIHTDDFQGCLKNGGYRSFYFFILLKFLQQILGKIDHRPITPAFIYLWSIYPTFTFFRSSQLVLLLIKIQYKWFKKRKKNEWMKCVYFVKFSQFLTMSLS